MSEQAVLQSCTVNCAKAKIQVAALKKCILLSTGSISLFKKQVGRTFCALLDDVNKRQQFRE
jgi:hypothetical protein